MTTSETGLVNEMRISQNRARGLPLNSTQKATWAEYQVCHGVPCLMKSISCPFCLFDIVLGEDKLCCDSMVAAAAIAPRGMEAESLSETAGFYAYLAGHNQSQLASQLGGD
jgi:hypothetical protein